MSGLVIAGVPIPIAASAPGSQDLDDGVDRGRAFDNTYRASAVAGAARDFHFSTPPLLPADAATYDALIRKVAPQLCSGDIIALPTMCCGERTGWTPVTVRGGHRVVLDFTLHEVQSARMLLKYAPGDTITGESFSRSTTATYFDANGVLQTAAINTKRDGAYIGGVRSTLLEGARTNLLLRSQEFDNAVWAKTGVTVTPNAIAAPDGTTTADKIEASVTTGSIMTQTATVNATSCTYSIFVKKGSGAQDGNGFIVRNGTTATILLWVTIDYDTGVVSYVTGSAGAKLTALTGTMAGWYRLTMTATSGITSGDSITCYAVFATGAQTLAEYAYAWGAMLEAGSFVSSYIPTTTATVARGADLYSMPAPPPQEMTVYMKLVERGTIALNVKAFEIANAAENFPHFFVLSQTGVYDAHHSNGVSSNDSQLAAAPAIGDTEELVANLFGDGSIQLTQSVNGAVSTSGAQSAPLALASAWSGALVWLNSGGTAGAPGFMALQSFKIVAGSRALAELRAA